LAIEAPSDERDGNRYAKPTATAPHPDSTKSEGSRHRKADMPEAQFHTSSEIYALVDAGCERAARHLQPQHQI